MKSLEFPKAFVRAKITKHGKKHLDQKNVIAKFKARPSTRGTEWGDKFSD